jgi:hypothetical protein
MTAETENGKDKQWKQQTQIPFGDDNQDKQRKKQARALRGLV